MFENHPSYICIVDDDADFVEFLTQYLEVRGLRAKGYEAAETLLKSGELSKFDFFILDLGLPGIDGVDLITLVRTQSSAGILVISGRMGPDAFNSALAAGADMFINKPVRFDQVYNAMASVCRRMTLRTVENAAWRINANDASLTAPDGSQVSLTPVELKILTRLCANAAHPTSRQELAEAAGITNSQDDRNLDSAIFRLRRKIEKDTSQPSPLKTVHGLGYQLSQRVDID
jgi:two-component system OmpR family response regulator